MIHTIVLDYDSEKDVYNVYRPLLPGDVRRPYTGKRWEHRRSDGSTITLWIRQGDLPTDTLFKILSDLGDSVKGVRDLGVSI